MHQIVRTSAFLILILFFCTFSTAYSRENLSIIADQIIYEENGLILRAMGNVIVQYRDYELKTPELTYNQTSGKLFAGEPIKLKTKEALKLLASSAEISDDFKYMITKHTRALINQQFYVQSEKVEKLNNGVSVFYSNVGTACEVCSSSQVPMWQIKSKKISHDPIRRKLHFKNAWMEFLGVPILYTPYFRIPEPGIRRATGLLTPKILTSNLLGVGMKQPYYINIDQSSDITASILKTTKTNLLLETEYRKLLSNGKFKVSGAAKARTSESLLDGYFQLNGFIKPFGSSYLNFDATAVSDSGFLGKYGYSDTDRLTSVISLNNQKKRSYSEISTTYFTSFRDNNQEEFFVAPNFYNRYFKYINSLGISTGTELSLVGLIKRGEENNLRFNFSVDTDKELNIASGFKVKGTTKLSGTLYRYHTNQSDVEILQNYNPTFAIALNAPMFRRLERRPDVLKPTLQLIYNPDLNNSDLIQNIDSQQVKLDQTSLFSLNRFSGIDKQESGLRLNTGIEYNVADHGDFSYDFALGQIFREAPSTQFSEGSGLSGIKSDILISGNINYNSLLTLRGQQLYDQSLKLKQAETTLDLEKNNKKLSSSLIYLEADENEDRNENLTEVTLGLGANLDKNWSGSLDLRRNLNANENINASLYLSYENECSRINLSFTRRFTETNSLPADTRVELSFDLNGLNSKKTSRQKSDCFKFN